MPSANSVLANVDVAGTMLVVTEDEVSFSRRMLKCCNITGIRYGIYKHYTNGIRDSQSYAIWLTDGRNSISVECAKGLFVRSATIETRYEDALKALYPAVIVPLIQRSLTNLQQGNGFQIGDVTFDKNGLHRSSSFGLIQKGLLHAWTSVAGGVSMKDRERRYQHLSWAEYGGHGHGEGKVYLYRERDKKAWVELALRDTWNAVCLGPLLDHLYKDGRLKSIVSR